MAAHAVLEIERDRHGSSRVQRLRSHAPLVLRPLRAHTSRCDTAARVALASAAAGPLGGDDFALDIRVGAGATLILSEISATLLLPGARGGRSRMQIRISVADDATLVWLAEPVIAATGCHHHHAIHVDLAQGARLLLRDELLLGRHREQPGQLTQNIRIRRAGQPLFHQQLRLGPGARGWRSPAVLGANKCIGTVLAVDPQWGKANRPEAGLFAPDAGLLPLAGPAVMVSALADDSLAIRRLLVTGMAKFGLAWAETNAPTARANPRTNDCFDSQPEPVA